MRQPPTVGRVEQEMPRDNNAYGRKYVHAISTTHYYALKKKTELLKNCGTVEFQTVRAVFSGGELEWALHEIMLLPMRSILV